MLIAFKNKGDIAVFDGVTAAEAVEGKLLPFKLIAITVKVYAIPFVRPVTVRGLVVPVTVFPSGDEVTVYPVIADPPFDAGAVKLNIASIFPAVAVTFVGTPGTADGVTAVEAVEGKLLPFTFIATTVKV